MDDDDDDCYYFVVACVRSFAPSSFIPSSASSSTPSSFLVETSLELEISGPAAYMRASNSKPRERLD